MSAPPLRVRHGRNPGRESLTEERERKGGEKCPECKAYDPLQPDDCGSTLRPGSGELVQAASGSLGIPSRLEKLAGSRQRACRDGRLRGCALLGCARAQDTPQVCESPLVRIRADAAPQLGADRPSRGPALMR